MTRKELRDYLGDLLAKREREVMGFNHLTRAANKLEGARLDLGIISDEIAFVEIKLTVLREVVAFLSVQGRSSLQKESDKRSGGVQRVKHAPQKKKVA